MIAPHPILGIIGGMGPEATVEFMARIVRATPARDDVDHLHMIVDNNPKIPSRIAALIDGKGESPAPELTRMAKSLEMAGATFLAMPCNTAHGYAREIRQSVSIPFLNMVNCTVEAIAQSGRAVGLLASTAVIHLGLYHHAFARRGISILVPEEQEGLMRVIKAVKRGDTGEKIGADFARIANDPIARGADVMLIACTELSILSSRITADIKVIDSLDVLRDAVLEHVRS